MASWWVWSGALGALAAGVENGLLPIGFRSIGGGKFVPTVRAAVDGPEAQIDRHNPFRNFGDVHEKAALPGLAAG